MGDEFGHRKAREFRYTLVASAAARSTSHTNLFVTETRRMLAVGDEMTYMRMS